MEKAHEKHSEKSKIRKYLLVILIIIFISLSIYLIFNTYINMRDKSNNQELKNDIIVNEENVKEENKNQSIIEKVKELKAINQDVKGWIKIDNTNINYPILQGEDNSYYLNKNYKKEFSNQGSIFLDKDADINNVNSNIIIYGHNMKNKEMFQNLINYKDKSYYEEHKNIEIITDTESMLYEIVSVFKSRVFYKNETNVFRYYYCKDLSTKEKYDEYINNCKNIELYDTGVVPEFGEQIITLIVCEYSQQNGRMVVVARKVS